MEKSGEAQNLRRCLAMREYRLHFRLIACRHGRFHISVRHRGERAIVRDVARNYKTARRLFDLISKGGVFPCHLQEVLEELVTEIE